MRKTLRDQQVLNLGSFALAHALVDGVCSAILVGLYVKQYLPLPILVSLTVMYNILAFGLQPVIGLIVDRFQVYRMLAISSLLMIAIASLLTFLAPWLAVIIAGIGNAIFHIAGGSMSLGLNSERASAPGIFVAPGALGLSAGSWLGEHGGDSIHIYLGIGLILASGLFWKLPQIKLVDTPQPTRVSSQKILLLLAILISISIRSLVGFMVSFPWKSSFVLMLILTLAISIGKGLGGILADCWGRRKIIIIALMASIPCLLLGSSIPWLGILGMLLFNLTMPITLVATASLLEGKPGFAFGLTCLALLVGYSPIVFGFQSSICNPFALIIAIIISFLFLYNGFGDSSY